MDATSLNYIEIEGFCNNGNRLYVINKGGEGYFMAIIKDHTIPENAEHKPINQNLYYALLESNQ